MAKCSNSYKQHQHCYHSLPWRRLAKRCHGRPCRHVATQAILPGPWLLPTTGLMLFATSCADLRLLQQRGPAHTRFAASQANISVLKRALPWIPLFNSLAWAQSAVQAGLTADWIRAPAGAVYMITAVAYSILPLSWLINGGDDSLMSALASSFLCLLHLQVHENLQRRLASFSMPELDVMASLRGLWAPPRAPVSPKTQASDGLQAVQAVQGSASPADTDEMKRMLADLDEYEVHTTAAARDLWDARFALRRKSLAELRDMARQAGIKGRSGLRKAQLMAALETHYGWDRTDGQD